MIMTDNHLKILLFSNKPEKDRDSLKVLQDEGYSIDVHSLTDTGLKETVLKTNPDALVVRVSRPGIILLTQIEQIMSDSPCPIILFAKQDDDAFKKKFINTDIASYIINGWQVDRLISIIKTAIFRFEQISSLKNEINVSRKQLDERKLIEKAKGIIMKKSSVDEDAAYKALQKKAMDKNLKMIDIARSVITASEILA